ncbi:hypothetical protein P2H44_22645 [Albimonas sp. CAU 1670]|uniref:spike base protein, RCAP_Rcc01079 family n=1 Tax=Albimonas sp. CAU 1670 TaxID=3032599 RepID=UPI0023DCA72D|nr:hypothetical protein [Albimonas sp. CAU 1670]MDF2235364.1 hypothetical protein [Albimonas sp. CAU 1670]
MANPFNGHSPARWGVGSDLAPVTPSDTVALETPAIGLFVEGAGDVVFVSAAGATRTVNLPAHGYLAVAVLQVLATDTTATGIHAVIP